MIYGDGGHASVIKDFWYGPGDIVAIGDNADRKRVSKEFRGVWGIAIHPTAYVSKSAHLEPGVVVMAHAVIQPHAFIGAHAIVNTGATVDHHCRVGAYAHIAPGAHLCGNVEIGEGTLVGVGVGIAPRAKIPAWSLVKARHPLEIVLFLTK